MWWSYSTSVPLYPGFWLCGSDVKISRCGGPFLNLSLILMMALLSKCVDVKALLLGSWRLYKQGVNPPALPVLNPDPWWGHENREERIENTDVRPFSINVSQEALVDLKTRLSLPLRLTHPLENSNFSYGFSSNTLKVFHHFWQNKYNWRLREQKLNEFHHYRTQIEGLDIHYIHATPIAKDLDKDIIVLPLLLIHGWPGSVVEFDKLLPILTKPRDNEKYVFEVICPSLPGYGFSQAASKQGLGALETAQIFLKLMKRLKFQQFYVQGGDWGSFISSMMATLYPENILGVHLNMINVMTPGSQFKLILGAFLPSGMMIAKDEESRLYPLSKFYSTILRESGYFHLQVTKPDTIGNALSNSPMGLAAYILEKFSTWTHKNNPEKSDGGLLDPKFPISFDRLLDNICLYWFTNSITSSMRFYAETFKALQYRLDEIPCDVPAGLAAFPQEIANTPESLISHKYTDIVSYTKHSIGGHFAAMEQPELLAADILRFVTIVENRKEKGKSEEL